MYKYLSLATNVQEMMVMLKSLPTCTIVFDRYGKLVDINQPALIFFKTESIDDYRFKRWRVLNDNEYLQNTIRKLKTGDIIRYEICIVKRPDYSTVVVNFSACMLNGASNVFLFQFFELSNSSSSILKYQSNANKHDSKISKAGQNDDIHKSLIIHKKKKLQFQPYVDVRIINALTKTISEKYPNFSNSEVFICVLIALGVSTTQMTIIIHEKVSYIYATIYKLIRISKLKSRKELCAILTEIYVNI